MPPLEHSVRERSDSRVNLMDGHARLIWCLSLGVVCNFQFISTSFSPPPLSLTSSRHRVVLADFWFRKGNKRQVCGSSNNMKKAQNMHTQVATLVYMHFKSHFIENYDFSNEYLYLFESIYSFAPNDMTKSNTYDGEGREQIWSAI